MFFSHELGAGDWSFAGMLDLAKQVDRTLDLAGKSNEKQDKWH